jgi:DNA repair protein RecN (Recombination protein N)
MVTVNELKCFMKNVIDIHGQYDNQTLLDKDYHTKYLDKFIGKEIDEISKNYIEIFEEYKELKRKLNSNHGDEKERQRELDLYKYELDEIEKANLKNGEEEELEQKRKVMINSEKISNNLREADEALNINAIDAIGIAIRDLEKIKNLDTNYSEKLISLKNSYYEIQEIAKDISYLKEDIYFDEEERNRIEERLDLINFLKRKYGNDVEEIMKFKEQLIEKISEIESSEENNIKYRKEIKEKEEILNKLCNQIYSLREKYRIKLNEKINKELIELEMQNARFNAKQFVDNDYSLNGKSHIEFLITTNIGEEEKKLDSIASGGELSRIMLAIKTVLSEIDEVPILIFDEIDTGISGKASNAVGLKLKRIGKSHQVIIVTHLAIIAAKGDYNYYIYKEVTGEKTNTRVKALNENETIEEIARISSGEISDITISHAKELRKLAVA